MTAEIKARLREAGIPVDDGWGESEEKVVSSPLIERQKETLRKLEKVVELQIREDQKRVSDFHATLMRLKHGGGS